MRANIVSVYDDELSSEGGFSVRLRRDAIIDNAEIKHMGLEIGTWQSNEPPLFKKAYTDFVSPVFSDDAVKYISLKIVADMLGKKDQDEARKLLEESNETIKESGRDIELIQITDIGGIKFCREDQLRKFGFLTHTE